MRAPKIAALAASSALALGAPFATVASAKKHTPCGKNKPAHTNCGKHKGASKGKKNGHTK
jgi:hypothetical protein